MSNRETEFRGVCVVDGEFKGKFVYGDKLTIGKKTYIHPKGNSSEIRGGHLAVMLCVHEVDPDTVGESTGLPSIDRTQIFEGDIVVLRDTDQKIVVQGIVRFDSKYVAFGNRTCGFYVEEKYADGWLTYSMADGNLEIIGNIHNVKDIRIESIGDIRKLLRGENK